MTNLYGTSLRNGFNQWYNLMTIYIRYNKCNHNPHRNSSFRQFLQGLQSFFILAVRGSRSRIVFSESERIDKITFTKLYVAISLNISSYQAILSDDTHRMFVIQKHSKQLSRKLKISFQELITIRVSRHHKAACQCLL